MWTLETTSSIFNKDISIQSTFSTETTATHVLLLSLSMHIVSMYLTQCIVFFSASYTHIQLTAFWWTMQSFLYFFTLSSYFHCYYLLFFFLFFCLLHLQKKNFFLFIIFDRLVRALILQRPILFWVCFWKRTITFFSLNLYLFLTSFVSSFQRRENLLEIFSKITLLIFFSCFRSSWKVFKTLFFISFDFKSFLLFRFLIFFFFIFSLLLLSFKYNFWFSIVLIFRLSSSFPARAKVDRSKFWFECVHQNSFPTTKPETFYFAQMRR